MIRPEYKTTKELDKAIIRYLNTDIFYVCYKEGVYLDVADFKLVRTFWDEALRHSPHKLLVEFPDFNRVSQEARQFAQDYPIDAVAEAIVYSGMVQGVLWRFYLLWNKQQHPVKAFRHQNQAVHWLNTF